MTARALHIALTAVAMGTACAERAPRAPAEDLAARLLEARDDPARVVPLRWQGTPRAEGGRPGSWVEKQIERRFNVALETSFLTMFSYSKRMTFLMMGGDTPDVYWLQSARELRRNARHGFALELPYEVIRRHAPAYAAHVDRHAPEAWILTHYEGRNFGVPLVNTDQATFPSPGIWRKDWLDRVGLAKVPETLDEMEEAFRRFRDRDPDGNGRRDTFGICTNRPVTPPETLDRTFEEIFLAHGTLASGWVERDGRAVWGGTVPEAKETLALLRRWYAEGLVWPDYMVAPAGNIELMRKLISGKVGYVYGANAGGYDGFTAENPASVLNAVRAVTRDGEVVPGPFPIGPRGHRGGRSFGGATAVLAFGPHLAGRPEAVVRVLRMLDEMARDEAVYFEAKLGQRGVHWDHRPERGFFALPPYDGRFHATREVIYWLPEIASDWGYFAPFGQALEVVDRWTNPARTAFRDRHRRAEWGVRDLFLQPEAVPGAERLLPDLVQIQAAAFAEIVTGRRPLEAFDAFVAEWRRRGGDELTRAANALLAEKPRILRRARLLPEDGDAPR